jgi:polysaccharide export outer membrane protein
MACCMSLAMGLSALPALGQASSGAPAADAKLRPYRINPGDEIEVYVWGEERLQRVVKILPDGTFSFPLVGQVDALNKLPSDIEAAVSHGLRSQYRENVPQVTVSVKSPAGLQFTVAGKVKAPGAFTPGRYVNVLEALVMAGGPADFANVGEIKILRKSGSKLIVIRAPLAGVLKGNPTARDLGDIPQLESGDSVIVP